MKTEIFGWRHIMKENIVKKFISSHPIIVMVIGYLLVFILFTMWGICFWGSSFIPDFWANWLATFLGVGIGVPVVLWANRFQEQFTERERKQKILSSLYEELDYCKLELDRLIDEEVIKTESGTLSSVLRNEIWNAYSDGGELEWIRDVSLLAQIADSYYSIRAISNLADRYYDSVIYSEGETPRIHEVVNMLISAIEYGRDSVRKTMELIHE
jgi:hypothetical protein